MLSSRPASAPVKPATAAYLADAMRNTLAPGRSGAGGRIGVGSLVRLDHVLGFGDELDGAIGRVASQDGPGYLSDREDGMRSWWVALHPSFQVVVRERDVRSVLPPDPGYLPLRTLGPIWVLDDGDQLARWPFPKEPPRFR